MKQIAILSLSYGETGFRGRSGESDLIQLVDKQITGKEDLVILPEYCIWDSYYRETDDFPQQLRKLAIKHHIYLHCPILRDLGDGKKGNTAILFDPHGNNVLTYDKSYPYWEINGESLESEPGQGAVCVQTEFGRISAAICFDANFPDLWQQIADLDADLVLFTSAYSAGTQLAAHALNHHYTIVTCTRVPDFTVYDLAGREHIYSYQSNQEILASRITLDLDRVICHYNFNLEKVNALLSDYPFDVEVEHDYYREQWIVLRSLSPDISLRELCQRYGIEPLREYQRRSRTFINAKRGHSLL